MPGSQRTAAANQMNNSCLYDTLCAQPTVIYYSAAPTIKCDLKFIGGGTLRNEYITWFVMRINNGRNVRVVDVLPNNCYGREVGWFVLGSL